MFPRDDTSLFHVILYPPYQENLCSGLFSQIKRPKKSAARPKIKIVNPITGHIDFQLNATDPRVTFIDRRIEFVPPREALFNYGTTTPSIQYKLQLDEGVAMAEAKSGCGSASAEWLVQVNGNYLYRSLSLGLYTILPYFES